MTNKTPQMNDAWDYALHRLNADPQAIVNRFHAALLKDMAFISIDGLNDALIFIEEFKPTHDASKWVTLFLEHNAKYNGLIEKTLKADGMHKEIKKQFAIMKRLSAKTGLELVMDVIENPEHREHPQKEEVHNQTKDQWLSILSEAEGENLGLVVWYIHNYQIDPGLDAIIALSAKSLLNRVVLERLVAVNRKSV